MNKMDRLLAQNLRKALQDRRITEASYKRGWYMVGRRLQQKRQEKDNG